MTAKLVFILGNYYVTTQVSNTFFHFSIVYFVKDRLFDPYVFFSKLASFDSITKARIETVLVAVILAYYA